MSRTWVLLILAITAGALGIALAVRPPEAGPDVVPPVEKLAERVVPVFFAERGDIEVALLSYYGESDRDDFNSKRVSEIVGGDGHLAVLWFLNHGKVPQALPFGPGGGVVVVDGAGREHEARRLSELAGIERAPEYFQRIARILSSSSVKEVAPNSLVSVAVALPAGTRLGQLSEARLRFGETMEFERRGLALSDRLAFERQPTGRLRPRLRYDERAWTERSQRE